VGDNKAAMERLKSIMEGDDFGALSGAINEFATDDFVQEWPQSGERIRRENVAKIAESYSGATGTNPKFTFKRMIGGGDVYVIEGTIDYGDGTPVSYVGITEFRDGRVAKQTEYYANPFEAPEWRRQFVEQMEPAGARR
jgi:hypothetical protein